MTVSEIYGNIRYNENLIDQYQAERRGLEAQIGELEALRNKFASLQERFGERQNSRRSNLQRFTNSGIHNQIIGRYFSGMSGLLSGWEFQNAYNGLDDAKYKINQKIRELDNKIDACEDNIRYRNQRRNYWLQQLYAAQAAEEGD
jgi:peptidoglycan hydrolase CwlO-like protein